jgi:hypothetical protein
VATWDDVRRIASALRGDGWGAVLLRLETTGEDELAGAIEDAYAAASTR